MVTLTGRHYASGAPLRLSWEGAEIVECAGLRGAEAAACADGPVLAPALWDIQINGYGGLDFSQEEHLARIAGTLATFGVARFCPTVVTGPDAMLCRSLTAIARARAASPALAAAVPCIHLEGPYISSCDGARGAHPLAHVRDPDWDHFQRLQEAADGLIGIVTLAPERAGAIPFIARCAATGVVVALGHTAADAATIAAAVDAGARLSTHLGNGLATPIDRHHNPLWPQLADVRLTASFIADGEHLPPAPLTAMIRAKGGARGSILVSDAVAEAGLPPGRYQGVGGAAVDVLPSGRIQLAGTPYLAGSGAHLLACVAHAVRCGAADLAAAVDMASIRPAGLLGHPTVGLEPGGPADLVALRPGPDGSLEACLTVRAGQVIHGAIPGSAPGLRSPGGI
jgi:N-acetylglucosamine-6-phosphate deacetylase